MSWEHFVHGADIGVRGVGCTAAEAFEGAALAMTAVVTDPTLVGDSLHARVCCQAPDLELLLVDWLNAVLGEMAVRGALFGRYRVAIEGNELQAELWGESVNVERHQPAVEIKGATYTCLQVVEKGVGQWLAQTVVDV